MIVSFDTFVNSIPEASLQEKSLKKELFASLTLHGLF